MTRFTRARGSKACNERLPDKPTPWHVMKQQLEQSIESSKSFQKQSKSKSVKILLQEIDDKLYYGEPGCVNQEWAEFESNNNNEKNCNEGINKSSLGVMHMDTLNNVEKISTSPQKLRKRKSSLKINQLIKDETAKCISSQKRKEKKTAKNVEITPVKLLKLNKNKEEKQDNTLSNPLDNVSDTQNVSFIENHESIDKPTVKFSKRQKRNRKNKMKSSDSQHDFQLKDKFQINPSVFNTEGNEWNCHVRFGYKKKSIKYNDEKNEFKNTNSPIDNSQNHNFINTQKYHQFDNSLNRIDKQKIVKKRKLPKIRDDKEHKRKKPNPGSKKVIINGMQVEIVMYDGFPLKKEDADRLNELRQQMVMKGIPKSEIDSAIKLERRKSEKALARIRKNVCFHCRKAGHNLSDCPDLGKEEAIMGICFKCGSTEHTHFECKVIKKQEFGYAKCFICREQGHIAKQCPDNPKGLYPNGGACKICGDVTHFKKDCPDLMKEKEETTLTLNTIADNIVESLETEKHQKKIKELQNKIIKF